MRRALLVAVALLAGCKSSTPQNGFAVDVTINGAALPEAIISASSSILIDVSGAETWTNRKKPYAITDKFASKQETWIYRPASSSSGTVKFTVTIIDGTNRPIAFGNTSATLKPGATVTATVTLMAQPSADMAVTGADMAAPIVGKNNGDPCKPGVDVCKSGNCVDGVCCDLACADVCSACNVPGFVGACTPVPVGMKPSHSSCAFKSPNDPVSPCSYDGTCDGANNCRLWPKNTVCRPSTCVANQYSPPSICDGAGSCMNLTGYDCTPFICKDTTICFGPPCADNSSCSGANTCNMTTGSCGSLPLGRACTKGAQCTSNNCVDGVCCDSACTGQCQACDADSSQLGKCLPVTGAPHPGGGLRSACSGNALNNCGGTCDGTAAHVVACVYPPATKPCVSPSCSGSPPASLAAANCDGNGSCPVPSPMTCPDRPNATAVCNGTVCGISCTGTYRDCNGDTTDGCEVDTSTNSHYCGNCPANSCASCTSDCTTVGQSCVSGVCQCPTGKKPCGTQCIDNNTCCTPADSPCNCVRDNPNPPYTSSTCDASHPYGWKCAGDRCTMPLYFALPTYANCGSSCSAELECCPSF